ncbi:MAG: winged helix-turn-helix transcriptional regulator [Nitrospira sp.]|nr:winged helix-turn-helix transcriptional regulator [Nitrospira sp.]MDH4242188.1 winged helix-turn-helix transcriptional regulator [Nitrospira sp.]MDH4357034.1 winged helix-turn-helix transcriptional regulator [Nitrospira sp.]MDH5317584.1 winged helix-turn-helix transcriptional regulator [Nitrospira sp.]
MDLQGQRDLLLLTEVERDGAVTQRSLATKLGVALGLTNLYLKRLARKGYIKITTIPSQRVRYLLTPQGFAEKSRLTYLYVQYSLSHYRDMRARLRDTLSFAAQTGTKRVVIYGTGELAELAYLSLREMRLTLVGFVSDGEQASFLSYPVWQPEALAKWEFDAVLLADIEQAVRHRDELVRQHVPDKKILVLGPSV